MTSALPEGVDEPRDTSDSPKLLQAEQQAQAMETQFRAPQTAVELAERAAWRRIRRAAAARRLLA